MSAAGTVTEALSSAAAALVAAGVDSPRLDAELLLSEATGRTREQLAAEPDAPVSGPHGRTFGAFVRRRVDREPVAYILGRRGFRNLDLIVDRRALIPRPETELLVEVALELIPSRILDVGTGSGAVALALADELPEAEVIAVDVSAASLAVARTNVDALGLCDRVKLKLGSWSTVVGGDGFDLVVANLPYVRDSERTGLEPEITLYEPAMALFAGADGLSVIRALLIDLALDGAGPSASAVALEVGEGQAGEVSKLVEAAGFGRVEIRPDLAGIDRVVLGQR